MASFRLRYFRNAAYENPDLGDTESWGSREVNVEIDFHAAALVLINVYGLLLRQDHPARRALVEMYGAEETDRREQITRQNILPVLQAARGTAMPVIYVADSAPQIALEQSNIRQVMIKHLGVDPIEAFAESCNDPNEYARGPTERIAYAEEFEPQPQDYYIRKWVCSGFYGTWLDRLLRNLEVKTIFLAGFNAESDLFCTALEGHWYGYRIVLLRECFKAIHIPEHEPVMDLSHRLEFYTETSLGYTVSGTDFVHACTASVED